MAAITLKELCVDKIIFEEPVKRTHANMTYHRIPIKYICDNGMKDELCVATNQLLTWGIQEHRAESKTGSKVRDGPVEYYSLPLAIADEETYTVFDSIFQKCREHLARNSVHIAIGRKLPSPENVNPFYFKMTDQLEIIKDIPPSLYPKLLTEYQKVRDPDVPPTIKTDFVDADENPIDPRTLIGCRATVIAAITVKEIFINASIIKIQLKVNDAVVLERINPIRRKLVGLFKKPTPCVLDELIPEPAEKQQDEQPPVKINTIIKRRQPPTQ